MISGTFPAKARRRLGLVVLAFFGFVLLPGCEPDPYPADLRYPFRTDLLVLSATGENVAETYRPGQLDNFLAGIRGKAKSDPDKFKFRDPAALTDVQRKTLRAVLHNTFGTPAAPRLGLEDDLDEPVVIQELMAEGPTLGKGSILYRRHCLHCHGVSGDGHGPTAGWINPPPRDFRRGLFKFTSVAVKTKPTRADLIRTLTEGIEGTAMPNFKYLKDDEMNAVLSYVIHLSIRGSAEFGAIQETLDGEKKADDPASLVVGYLNDGLGQWRPSDREIKPLPWPAEYDTPEGFKKSISEGYQLFIGEAGGCVACHTDFGRQSTFRYDAWGTLVKPNNLTVGVFRGGRRPVDIFYRIAGGIDPSTMPAAGSAIAGDAKKMWALVNFVRALPYPSMLPDDVKLKVYGPSGRK